MSKKSQKKRTSSKAKAANQQNAQQSTGPKSPETQAISAANSLKHGLTSQKFKLLSWEDPVEFEALRTGLIAQYQPHTVDEDILLSQIIHLTWQINRVFHLETRIIETLWDDSRARGLELSRMSRYRANMQRHLDRAYEDLFILKELAQGVSPRPDRGAAATPTPPQPAKTTTKTPRPEFAHLPPDELERLAEEGRQKFELMLQALNAPPPSIPTPAYMKNGAY